MFARTQLRIVRAAAAAGAAFSSSAVVASQPNVAVVGSAESVVFRSLCRGNASGDAAAVTCFEIPTPNRPTGSLGHNAATSAQFCAFRHVLRKADEPLSASSLDKRGVSLLDLHQGSYDAVVVAGDDPSTVISAAAAALLCARNGVGLIVPVGSSGLLADYLRTVIRAAASGGLGGIFAARAAMLGLEFTEELRDERSWNRLAAQHGEELSWLHMPAQQTGGALLRGVSEHLAALSEEQVADVALGPAAAVSGAAVSATAGQAAASARPFVQPAAHVALPEAADEEVAAAVKQLLRQVVLTSSAGGESGPAVSSPSSDASSSGARESEFVSVLRGSAGQYAVRRAQWLQWGSDAVLRHAVRLVAASSSSMPSSSLSSASGSQSQGQAPLSGSAAAASLLQGLAKDAAADKIAGFTSATVAHGLLRTAATHRAAAAAQANSAAAALSRSVDNSHSHSHSHPHAASAGLRGVAAEDPFGFFPYPFSRPQGASTSRAADGGRAGAGVGSSFSSPRDQALFSWLAVRAPNAAPLLTAAANASVVAEKTALSQTEKLQLFHASVEVEGAAAAVAGSVPV